MKFLFFIIVSNILLIYVASEHITAINVPSMVVVDSDQQAVLDCQYDLKNDSSSLVVKWFKDDHIIYQWIRGQNPSAFPDFKNWVDETFEISSEPDQQFRALALVNPTIEATGVYKCVVQTGIETSSLSKRLQVIDIRNYTLDLYQHQIQNETHLECVVDNVYPQPTLTLASDHGDTLSVLSRQTNKYENGLYNATVKAIVEDNSEDLNEFTCTLTFMDLSLNLTTSITSGCTASAFAKIMILFVLGLKILI